MRHNVVVEDLGVEENHPVLDLPIDCLVTRPSPSMAGLQLLPGHFVGARRTCCLPQLACPALESGKEICSPKVMISNMNLLDDVTFHNEINDTEVDNTNHIVRMRQSHENCCSHHYYQYNRKGQTYRGAAVVCCLHASA